MKKLSSFIIVFSFLIGSLDSFSQTRTTVQDGLWDNPATWGGVAPPDFNVGAITVNHNVIISNSSYPVSTPLVVDQVTIGATGTLTINSGAAIQIGNGGGTDLTVNATGLLTISNGAEFVINSGVTFNIPSVVNAVFQPGSVIRTAAANLPTATGLDGIDIFIQDVVANLTLNATWNQLGANTTLNINCPNLGNRIINFGGFITSLNKLEILNTDGTAGGRVAILNGNGTATLSVGSGGINIQNDSRFSLTSTGIVTLNMAADLVFNSSSVGFSFNATSGTGTINFNGGDFIMTGGEWRTVGSGGGSGLFNFNGAGSDMLVSGGLLSENGNAAGLGIFSFNDATGSQTMDWIPSAIGPGSMNLVVAKSSASLNLTNALTISSITLTSGNLVTNGNNLTVTGVINVTSGFIDATATVPASTFLTITGTGTLAPSIPFVPGSVLSNLLLNRAGATLAMTNVSMQDGALVTITAGSITAPLGAAGVYDILYNNTAALVTGSEIPLSATVLRNMTKTGNGSVTLSSAPTINGDLTIGGASSMAAGTNNVSLKGNFVNNVVFTQSAGTTFTFLDNIHSVSGTSSATLGSLVVNGDLTVSNVTTTLLGDLTINTNASLNATAGTFAFNVGPHVITNSGTSIQFNNVSIGNGGATMTAPLNGTISIAGNFSGNGAFISNGSTVIFNGTTILSGSVKAFNNITVASLASLSGATGFSILSDLVNNGTISFTAGTMTWNSTGTFSGSSPAALNTISVPATRTLNLTLGGDLVLLNDLALAGNFNHTSAFNVTVGDDLTGNGNLTSVGTITFTGVASGMTGNGIKNFKNLAVTGTLTVGANTSYTITDGSINVTGIMSTNSGSGIVTINGNTSIVSTGISTTINFLLINGTLNAAGNVNLRRNFTNNGTFNAGTGTVSFSGSVTQSIQGSSLTTFNNINVNNTNAFVNVQSNQNLQGILTLGPAALFDADGTTSTSVFTLLSTSSIPVSDGAIAAIPADATFNGNVTIQRFMQNAGNVNRYISSPIIGMAVSQLDFTIDLNPYRFYDETVAGVISRGYKALPLTGSFETGRGYLAYMYDAADITWDVTGAIHQGSVSLPVSYTTTSGGPNADGWNLVGNPYPSGIIWESGTGWSLTNIDPVVSVTDLSIATGYPTYYHTSNFNDNSGDLPNDFIAMGQAFWVHANAANPSLTVNESAKSPATGGDFYRKSSTSEQLIIAINNGTFQDRSFLKINPEATEGYDRKFDGYKLKNEEMNIYLIDSEQRNLVMHTFSEIPLDLQIPVGVEVMQPGEYTISFANADGFSLGAELYLIDRFEGKVTPVTSVEGYTFKTHATSMTITDRFYISRTPNLSAESISGDWLQTYPNPVKDVLTMVVPVGETAHATLMDTNGQTLWADQIKGEAKVDLKSYAAGLYLLKVSNGKEMVIRKILR